LPRRYFAALQRVFADDCEVLTVVDGSGHPLSSVLSFLFSRRGAALLRRRRLSARELAANDFKYWELMRRSCERGLKVFDYGRSKQGTGSYAFKKNWGFEPQPLFYEYCLYRRDAIPQNNPSNAKYRLLINTWRRMPIGLANWLGPFIVRNLG
jgi:FemAB-related protein (PEP-CTERM system-associated)